MEILSTPPRRFNKEYIGPLADPKTQESFVFFFRKSFTGIPRNLVGADNNFLSKNYYFLFLLH